MTVHDILSKRDSGDCLIRQAICMLELGYLTNSCKLVAISLVFHFQGHIDLFKQGSELIYRLKGTSRARGGDAEEKIVYGIIEEAGNKVGGGLSIVQDVCLKEI